MKAKIFYGITLILFSIVFVLQIFRSVYQWDVKIGLFTLPVWPSYLAVIISGYLAYTSYVLLKTK